MKETCDEEIPLRTAFLRAYSIETLAISMPTDEVKREESVMVKRPEPQ